MNSMKTLSDAFAELERRADAATTTLPADDLARVTTRHRRRGLLIAASVVAALAVAGGTAWLTSTSSGTTHKTQAGGSPPTISSTPSTTPAFTIPDTPDELASRFRTVLGDTATFTVTDTGAPVTITAPPSPTEGGASGTPIANDAQQNGAAIVGTLTADGVTGGFDIQMFRAQSADRAMCDDPDRSHCTVRTLADGSSLAVGHEPLQNAADGVTYEVYFIRTDGVAFLMHVSNEKDPKGASAVLATYPPLTTDQMTAIVMSSLW